MEAVIFGSNGKTGTTIITNEDECGDFTGKFNRKWLIHKATHDNRPVTLLVGAQNNLGTQLGMDDDVVEYYNYLNAGNDIGLIIADSPQDIDAGNYKAIIPMNYINGEHQCSYDFTEIDTYITFAWKPNNTGCVIQQDAAFTGTKKFDWTQWTSRTNTNPSNTTELKLVINDPVDLGDNIAVMQTEVSYPSNVMAYRGFPRSVNIPNGGSLEVRRRRGTLGQDVEITVTFNQPVIPEFSISGLDAYGSRSYEEVTVTGECSGSPFAPVLSYASDPKNARYKIVGNKATVTKRGGVSGSNKNGMVNVKFNGGVSQIIIKYRTTVKATTALQRIYISPITLRSVTPLPPVNKEGLSFVKQVKERSITTCEAVEYSFFIQNVTCDSKTVNFSDILPENMKWEVGSIGLDAVASEFNPSFDYQIIAGEELQINNLNISGATTLIVTATALFNEEAQDGEYANRATITYMNESGSKTLQSVDRETLEPYTVFYATRHQFVNLPVVMEEDYSVPTYKADIEIEATYTLINTNDDITDLYLDIDFNEEFTYIPDSFEVQIIDDNTTPVPVLVTLDPDDTGILMIAKNSTGEDGFTLPAGKTMIIKYKLKAPDSNNLQDELNNDGNPTGKKANLEIHYSFSSTMDDPCALMAIDHLQGTKIIPYSFGKIDMLTDDLIEKCEGESLTLSGTYIDDGTCGSVLYYCWRFSGLDIMSDWKDIPNSGGSVSNGIVTTSYTIPALTEDHAGYYRLVIGFGPEINTVNFCTSSEIIEVIVNPLLPHSVTISESDNDICANREVTFTAVLNNSEVTPTYQWKKNGTIINGATASTYTYIPENKDIITCEATSTITCASPPTAVSNSITMRVSTAGVKPSIMIYVK